MKEKKRMFSSKHVVLVNNHDEVLGIEEKLAAHHANTHLHRGFSAFLFNKDGEFLLQKRASHKKTWPGFWSNSFCGHPQIDETYVQAVHRHAKFELGINLTKATSILNYRYKFVYNDIAENEICPVFLANTDEKINPNPQEIEDIKWITWPNFLYSLEKDEYTPWCKEESEILHKLQIL